MPRDVKIKSDRPQVVRRMQRRIDKLLAVLTDHARRGACCPSDDRLADAVGCSRTSVEKDLAQLRHEGVITSAGGACRVITIVSEGVSTGIQIQRHKRLATLARKQNQNRPGRKATYFVGPVQTMTKTNEELYGCLADDVVTLRRDGHVVIKVGSGRWLFNNRAISSQVLQEKAEQVRRLRKPRPASIVEVRHVA